MPARGSSVVGAVAEQYERFPYPPVDALEQEDPSRDLRASFNVDFGLRGARALPPGARIWVPGCGTRWAVMVALAFGDARILATDLSESSLEAQSKLARSLGCDNIEFRREDLLEAGYDGEFDFVSCVGVLHHLPDPDRGFLVMGRALKATGLLEVMVYDGWNRQYSHRMQQILGALDPDGALDASTRFELALRVLRGINRNASAPAELSRILEYVDSWPGFRRELADFISHPHERYYDVPSLVEALAKGGLAPRVWKQPYRFDPGHMLDDPELSDRVARMSTTLRAHLGHLLSTGLLEVFAERSGASDPGPAEELRARRVRAVPKGLTHRLGPDGRVFETVEHPKLVKREKGLRFDGGERRPAVLAYGVDIDCIRPEGRRLMKPSDLGFGPSPTDEQIEAILEVAEGPGATIGAIASEVSRRVGCGEESVARLCDRLCRTPFRVLATI